MGTLTVWIPLLVVSLILLDQQTGGAQVPKFLQKKYGTKTVEGHTPKADHKLYTKTKTAHTKSRHPGRHTSKMSPVTQSPYDVSGRKQRDFLDAVSSGLSGSSRYISSSSSSSGSRVISSSSGGSSGGFSFQGGCVGMPSPMNAGVKCSSVTGCTATCMPDSQFPNGKTELRVLCQNGQWFAEGFSGVPNCERRFGSSGLSGSSSSSSSSSIISSSSGGSSGSISFQGGCVGMPSPMNAAVKCSSLTGCRATCMPDSQFSNGKTELQIICQNGQWLAEGYSGVPNCQRVSGSSGLSGSSSSSSGSGIISSGGSSGSISSSGGSSGSISFQGGCVGMPSPMNAAVKCSSLTGCRATCMPDSQFPNGKIELQILCQNGQWLAEGFSGVPNCQRVSGSSGLSGSSSSSSGSGIISSGGSSGSISSSGGSSGSISFQGGCAGMPSPMNAGVRCSSLSGCKASCIQDYQFPNGKTEIRILCQDGKWLAEEFSGVPNCEPICLPQCQNNGICLAPNQCSCAENFSGPQCQFESKPCLNYPPMPKNSKRSCNSKKCTISCMKGHEFPDGSQIATMDCKNGLWIPSKEKWTSIPNCQATCDPPCLNGGNCLSFNVCQCPQEFRGPQCQYSAEVCNPKNMGFNGGYNCSGDANTFSCALKCPVGIDFEFPPVPVYTCDYALGFYLPAPIPDCVYPDGSEVHFIPGTSETHITFNYTEWISTSGGRLFLERLEQELSLGVNVHIIIQRIQDELKSGKLTIEQKTLLEKWEKELSTGALTEQKLLEQIKVFPMFTESPSGLTEVTVVEGGNGGSESIIVETKLPAPGTCFAWGGSHYKTFDNRIYSFKSRCPHVLVRDSKDSTFSIITQDSDECQSNPELCHKNINIFLQNVNYLLSKTNDGQPLFKSGDKVLPIPGRVPGIRVEMEAHNLLVSLDTVGVEMLWDGRNLIQVAVKENLWNRTEGLCGILDGDVSTDIVTQDGEATKNILTFASSWKVDYIGNRCEDSPSEDAVCTHQPEKAENATNFCNKLIKDNRFRQCQNLLDIGFLYDACRSDYCNCLDSNDPTACACDNFDVYVKHCTLFGIKGLSNWRDENTCPMKCSNGKIYQACGSVNRQPTCGSISEGKVESDEKCVEGCFCPEGTVLHEGSCITRDKCPCMLRGKSFEAGASVPKDCNTCTCSEGQWICTQAMNFPLSILSGMPSCTKTVTIRVNDQIIKLKQNHELVVNGQDIIQVPFTIAGIRIKKVSSIFLQTTLPNGIDVWWDGSNRVYIDLPAKFNEETRGLCGTFNNNQKDDFLTPQDDVEQSVIAFANKWKTTEHCQDLPEVVPTHPCDRNIHRRGQAEEYCAKIKSELFKGKLISPVNFLGNDTKTAHDHLCEEHFQFINENSCHWFVDPEQFYKDCLYDMCSCESPVSKCLCPIMASYASECSRQGIKVDWRSEVRECGVHCPGGQKYQVCGDSCSRTCRDISDDTNCKPQCVEGCNCPDGQTLDDNGECIPIGQCKCHYRGMEFPPGYREIRPATKAPELCSCVSAVWECFEATQEDIEMYPSSELVQNKCNASANLEFTTCEPVEPLTCKNMHSPPQVSPAICHSGCKCKEGYVLDTTTKRCVKPTECPCHHASKSYKEGAIVQSGCNTCTCRNGKWGCTDRQCAAECSAWGDSHYKTFDGKRFDYQGECDYVLAKGSLGQDSFHVSVQNVPCGSLGTACFKSVTIKVTSGGSSDVITLEKDKRLPSLKTFKHITVREKSLFVIVEAPDLGFVVHWDRGTRVYVRIDPRWKDTTKGLCGNYNDNEVDDFQTPSGGLAEVSANIFGDSWRLQSYCTEAPEIKDTCEQRPDRKVWATKKCGVLKSSLFSHVTLKFP
ncbi:unnamed protein product [Diabrotica balteata]|uniref:Uncharacterized protein n=1 Tax=Diabrotica balteata TaxID=107213 RepID=A0A9N9XET9_DIABA|nr:unnamed protein product [Diabrotica balteata]